MAEGRPDAAAEWYRQALAQDPGDASAWSNLGECLRRLGKLREAELTLVEGLAVHRQSPVLMHNLAVVLDAKGELEAAERVCRHLLAQIPAGHEGAFNTLAAIAFRREAFAAAEDWWRRALALNPAAADGHCNLSVALWRQLRLDEARQCLLAALRIAPDMPRAVATLGWVCRQAGRHDEAAQWFERACALAPQEPALLIAYGYSLLACGRVDGASSLADALIGQGLAEAMPLRGDCARAGGLVADAAAWYRRALAAGAGVPDVLHNLLGHALVDLGDVAAATTHFRAAIAANPDNAEARANLGQTLLLAGDFAEGLREYEWRWQSPTWPARRLAFPRPLWRGEPLAGKTILLEVEQGLGDTMMFVRYARMVKALGARVVMPAEPGMERLLKRVPGVDALLPRPVDPTGIDFLVNAVDLARLLGTTLATIPAEIPYLSVSPRLVSAWRKRIGPKRGVEVGLVWGGNVTFGDDRNRSPRLAACLPLLDVPGTTIVGLQLGGARADLDGRAMPDNFVDLGPRIGDLADSAAIIAGLDLVVTSDTAVAHLAGGMGRPVWVMLKAVPDWRWMLGRNDSPWYPTMRLFRQPEPGDWASVVAEIRRDLLRLATPGDRPE